MYQNNDYIYDASLALEKLTGLSVTNESRRKEYDGIIEINGHTFTVLAKNELRKETKGLLFTQLEQLRSITNSPTLVIGKYIATDVARELKENGINYLDVAGNCYIKQLNLVLFISGVKIERKIKTNQTKAFQEAGLKIIFHLLSNPKNLQLSYRDLSEMAGVSIGSVSNVMKELENLNFILKTKLKRILKNKPELLERWIIAYHDVLRPRLAKKLMRFSAADTANNWVKISFNNNEGTTLWGGEPGGAILTNQLLPEKFCIYTTESWQNIGQKYGLVPDINGSVEILQLFWKDFKNTTDKQVAPPLLVYADLIGSGFGRNIETAKIILENELQHIK